MAINRTSAIALSASLMLGISVLQAADAASPDACKGLPSHGVLRAALKAARSQDNGGFNLDMWATSFIASALHGRQKILARQVHSHTTGRY